MSYAAAWPYCAKTRSSDSINIREVLLGALDRTQRFGTNQTSSMRAVGPQKPVETISRSTVRLRRLSIVISERSAKSLPTLDATVGPAGFPRWRDEFVIETLVIPLQMIMGDESANTRAEVIFSQRYHAAEALAFDRSNKTFGVGVQIRASRRQLHRLHIDATKCRAE